MTSNPTVFSSHSLSPTFEASIPDIPSLFTLLVSLSSVFTLGRRLPLFYFTGEMGAAGNCSYNLLPSVYELASATVLLSLLLLRNKCSRSLWTELLSLLLWTPSSFAFSGSSWIISSLSLISYFSLLFVFLPFVIRNVKTAVMFPHFFLSFRAKHCCRIYTPPPCFHFLCFSFPFHFSLASTQDPIKNC